MPAAGRQAIKARFSSRGRRIRGLPLPLVRPGVAARAPIVNSHNVAINMMSNFFAAFRPGGGP
jgi:hypothetical protein